MRHHPSPKLTYLTLILLLLLGFGLRLYDLGGHSLWYDELLQLDIAQGSLADIGPQLPRHSAMPLDYYLLHGWIALGRQEGWVRLPAVFFGLLAIPLIYALGQRLFNARVALLAATLLTFAPFAVRYSREARPYALLLCCTLVTFLGLWQVYRTQKLRYWLLLGLGLSGAVLSHFFGLFLLAPLGIWVAVHGLQHINRHIYWRHVACFALVVLGLTLILAINGRLLVLYSVSYQYGQAVTKPTQFTRPATEKPNRGPGPGLTRNYIVDNVLAPLSVNRQTGQVIYGLLLTIGALSMLRPRPRGRHSGSRVQRAGPLLLSWLILPVALIYLFLLHRGTFFASRYIFYVLPAFLLLTAYGLDRLSRFFIRLGASLSNCFFGRRRLSPGFRVSATYGLLLGPLLALQAQNLYANYTAQPYEDWRAAAALLHRHAQPDDAIIAPQAEPAMNWYYPAATAPFGAYLNNETLRQTIIQHPRRWFVLSSYSHRRDAPLREWLAKQGAVRLVIDRRIVVYYHQQGFSADHLLAQAGRFDLPAKPLTYVFLGDQFSRRGDYSAGRDFYRQAVILARTPEQRTSYQARLEALSTTGVQ